MSNDTKAADIKVFEKLSASKKKAGNPTFKKGGPSFNPNGRPRGPSVLTLARAKAQAKKGITPLEFLTALVRCNAKELKELGVDKADVTLGVRATAATQAAPYIHRKMPLAVDNTAGGSLVVFSAEQLMKMSDEELEALDALVNSIAKRRLPVQEGHLGQLTAGEDTGVEDAHIIDASPDIIDADTE